MNTTAEPGFAEGDLCARDGCSGRIAMRPSENCSCHISPPCGSCTAPRGFCSECDWEEVNDPEPAPTPQAEKDVWASWAREQDRLRRLPLDNTRVSWRSFSHSSCSMVKEGVFPFGTSREAVRKEVDGTFGGRFESFDEKRGTFKFIAYTD